MGGGHEHTAEHKVESSISAAALDLKTYVSHQSQTIVNIKKGLWYGVGLAAGTSLSTCCSPAVL
jgi:hypothetical protein